MDEGLVYFRSFILFYFIPCQQHQYRAENISYLWFEELWLENPKFSSHVTSCDMLNFCFEHNVDSSSSLPSFFPSPSSPSPFLALQACNMVSNIFFTFLPLPQLILSWFRTLFYLFRTLFWGNFGSLFEGIFGRILGILWLMVSALYLCMFSYSFVTCRIFLFSSSLPHHPISSFCVDYIQCIVFVMLI